MQLLPEKTLTKADVSIAISKSIVATKQLEAQYNELLDVSDGFLKRKKSIGQLRQTVRKLS